MAVISLPPPVFPETQFFVETSRRRIRLSYFQKNGVTVGLLSLKEQSVHQLLPDSHPANRRSNDDILEFPFGRHVPGHEKADQRTGTVFDSYESESYRRFTAG